jgi:Cdc6-like AAA superfamily ATPase
MLVVGPAGTGKTAALRLLSQRDTIPYLNVGIELSQRLVDLSEQERPRRVSDILEEILASLGANGMQTVIMDNLDLLFSPEVKQDPLRLLQAVSRQRTIIAAWNGRITDGQLSYAEPGYKENRRCSIKDLAIVEAGPADSGAQDA